MYFFLLPYLSSESFSCLYKKLPNIVIHACTNITEKGFAGKSVVRNLDIFIYVSINNVGTFE